MICEYEYEQANAEKRKGPDCFFRKPVNPDLCIFNIKTHTVGRYQPDHVFNEKEQSIGPFSIRRKPVKVDHEHGVNQIQCHQVKAGKEETEKVGVAAIH